MLAQVPSACARREKGCWASKRLALRSKSITEEAPRGAEELKTGWNPRISVMFIVFSWSFIDFQLIFIDFQLIFMVFLH